MLALAQTLKTTPNKLQERVASILEDQRGLTKAVQDAQQKLSADQGSNLATQAQDIGPAKFVAAKTEGDSKSMMQTLDLLRSQLGDCVVVLGCEDKGKLNLVVGVSKNLTESITAPGKSFV